MSPTWIIWGCILLCQSENAFSSSVFEYIIDLNVTVIITQADEDGFVSRIENEFNISTIQNLSGGSIRMLHVSATEESVEAIQDLPEVNLVEENANANLTAYIPSCHKIAVPETWGLDRIDQREILVSQNHKDWLTTFFRGTYRGKSKPPKRC